MKMLINSDCRTTVKADLIKKNFVVIRSEITKIIESQNSEGEMLLQECKVVTDEKGSYLIGNGIGFKET